MINIHQNLRKEIIKSKECMSDLRLARKLIKEYQKCDKKNIPFDLTLEQLKKLLQVKYCQYYLALGKKVLLNNTEGDPHQRTFDRKIPLKGYVFSNIVVCSLEMNGQKGNATPEVIEALYRYNKQADRHARDNNR